MSKTMRKTSLHKKPQNSEEDEEEFQYELEDGKSESDSDVVLPLSEDILTIHKYEKIPNWIKEMLPRDLTDVLEGKIRRAKCAGRKTSIEADNVNDLAYHINKKKDRDQLQGHLKKEEITPFKYSMNKKKIKCFTYLSFELQKESYVFDSGFFSYFKSAPNWYIHLYLFQAIPTSLSTDTIYEIIFNSPHPIKCIALIVSQFAKIKENNILLTRKTIDNAKDIAFYKKLSEKDKDKLLTYIYHNQVTFSISEPVFQEGNFDRLVLFLGLSKACDLVLEKKLFKEFQTFVQNHQNSFKDMHNYIIIKPFYKSLYPFAFQNASFSEIYKGFYKYFGKLVTYDCMNEITFLISKGWEWDKRTASIALRSLKPNIIKMIPKKKRTETLDFLLKENFPNFYALPRMGFYPSMQSIEYLYHRDVLRKDCINFKVIDYVDPNQPLDPFKTALALYHPELISKFIYKFSYRFEDDSLETWGLDKSWSVKNYLKACEALGVPPEMYVKKILGKLLDDDDICCLNDDGCEFARFCLKHKNIIKLNGDDKYLRLAIRMDNIDLAVSLVNCGADVRKKYLIENGSVLMRKALLPIL